MVLKSARVSKHARGFMPIFTTLFEHDISLQQYQNWLISPRVFRNTRGWMASFAQCLKTAHLSARVSKHARMNGYFWTVPQNCPPPARVSKHARETYAYLVLCKLLVPSMNYYATELILHWYPLVILLVPPCYPSNTPCYPPATSLLPF